MHEYGHPVALVVDYCAGCGDDHEIEVSVVGYERWDVDGWDRTYKVRSHDARSFCTLGREFLAFYEPGELDALVRGYREAAA